MRGEEVKHEDEHAHDEIFELEEKAYEDRNWYKNAILTTLSVTAVGYFIAHSLDSEWWTDFTAGGMMLLGTTNIGSLIAFKLRLWRVERAHEELHREDES
jgi:hypothetical protein